MSWTPIFSDLVDSSVWRLPYPTRLAWITILAKKHYRTHRIRTNPFLLSEWAGITEEEASEAIQVFLSPDPASLNPAEEGRRLKEVAPNDYLVVNGALYAAKTRAEINRQQTKDRMREKRGTKIPEVQSSSEPLPTPTEHWSEARRCLSFYNETTGSDVPLAHNESVQLIAEALAVPGVTSDGVREMIKRETSRMKGTKDEEFLGVKWLFRKESFGTTYGNRLKPVMTETKSKGMQKSNWELEDWESKEANEPK